MLTTEEIQKQSLMLTEEKARNSVNTKAKLKRRFLCELSSMRKGGAEFFRNQPIDYENKCIISNDGKWILVWKLRKFPNKPESYENQQTSLGWCGVLSNE